MRVSQHRVCVHVGVKMCLFDSPHGFDLLRLILPSHFLRLTDADCGPGRGAYGEHETAGGEDNEGELILAHLIFKFNFLPKYPLGNRNCHNDTQLNEFNYEPQGKVGSIPAIVRGDYLK